MTGMQQIPISQDFSLDESESKGIVAEKNLLQVCYTYESESERFIANESSMGIANQKVFTKVSTQTK